MGESSVTLPTFRVQDKPVGEPAAAPEISARFDPARSTILRAVSKLDLIIRGGTVVTAREVLRADIGVQDGRIVAFQPEFTEAADEIIEAAGWHALPGVIDAHVHFNEPGRTEWEGLASGSRALAAGGGTLFFDMPLNSNPPVLDPASFHAKRTLAARESVADFAIWGGLTPRNLEQVEPLAGCGVIGLKAFMCASGMDEFPAADERTLREGMKRAAQMKLLVAVHAESEATTRQLTEERAAHGVTTARDFLDSRPIEAELEAIRVALDLAGETGCPLHIVHVSCGEGVALVAAARARGVDATCETCPHYLTLSEEDFLAQGAVAKCAPPLRPLDARARLWQRLLAGEVATVGSDHSPAPAALKTGDDFFKIWGGIAGVQHTLPLLLHEGHHQRGLELPAVSRLLSHNVALRFRLPPEKGGLKIGGDADIALVDLGAEFEVQREELLDRHRLSPYVGRRLRGRVRRTLLRGQTIFSEGKILPKPAPRLIKPLRNV